MIPFFRSGVVGMVLILLAAGWLYLYTHSHAVHPESQDAILSQLKDLKQLDSTWNVDVLKSQAGINKSYDPLTQPLAEFADLFAKLKPEVESSKNVGLVSDLASIEHAIDQKTVLIDDFKAHNALLTNSLRYVPTVNETIQNGLRAQRVLAVTEGSHVSVPDRLTAEQHPLMRGTSRSYRVNAGTGRLLMLVGFEEDISALVSNVLDYNSMPDAQSEASLYVRLERVEGTLGFIQRQCAAMSTVSCCTCARFCTFVSIRRSRWRQSRRPPFPSELTSSPWLLPNASIATLLSRQPINTCS
jgi:hypothetical protein